MSYLTNSHFGGFLLHRGWFRLALTHKARAVLSTGCRALSPHKYVHRADDIGVVLVAAIDALEFGLRFPVFPGDMPAAWAGLAGVVRWNGNENAAVPIELVLQLPPEFEPTLVEDGLVLRMRLYCFALGYRPICAAMRGACLL